MGKAAIIQNKKLAKLLKLLAIASGSALAVLLAYLDYTFGLHPALAVFYLAPIALLAWFGGLWPGIIITLFSLSAWFASDIKIQNCYAHPIISCWNTFAKFFFLLIAVLAIAKLKKSLEREKQLSRVDYLTGLANGRYFSEITSSEIERSRRYKHPFSIAHIDLDDFKKINDLYGHSAGDKLLCLVAETIKESIRTTDLVARLGGDEFVVLLPETGYAGAGIVVERIKNSIAGVSKDNNRPVNASIGVVTCIQPPDSLDELLRLVVGFMYMAKNL